MASNRVWWDNYSFKVWFYYLYANIEYNQYCLRYLSVINLVWLQIMTASFHIHILLYLWMYIATGVYSFQVWWWSSAAEQSEFDYIYTSNVPTWWYYLLQEIEILAHECHVSRCLRCRFTVTVPGGSFICLLFSHCRNCTTAVWCVSVGLTWALRDGCWSQWYLVINLSCCEKSFHFCCILFFNS